MKKEEADDLRVSLFRFAVFIGILFLFLVILRYTLGHQLEDIAGVLVDRFGYPGMFITTLLMDTFIVPISPDIILFVAIAGEVDILATLVVVTIASMIGGHLGYLIGKFLGNRKMVQKRIAPYEERGHALMESYGLWAIIVGAMTPIPFSAVCWIAGMLDMSYPEFLAGVTWRIPRFLLWYIILALGFKGLAW